MIYLLRHGQTQFDSEGRIEGRCNSELTALGRKQALAMGYTLRELLANGPSCEILSSSSQSAIDCARIVREAAQIERPVIADARLQEVNFGSWEKHHFTTICERDPLVAEAPSLLSAWAHYCRDGESLDDAIERLWGWLCWAGSQDLVVIGHDIAGSILRTLYSGGAKKEVLACRPVGPDVIHQLSGGWMQEISVLGAAG